SGVSPACVSRRALETLETLRLSVRSRQRSLHHVPKARSSICPDQCAAGAATTAQGRGYSPEDHDSASPAFPASGISLDTRPSVAAPLLLVRHFPVLPLHGHLLEREEQPIIAQELCAVRESLNRSAFLLAPTKAEG